MATCVIVQVLYVPDQDELSQLAPPTTPVSKQPVTSSVDSEATPTLASTEVENKEEGVAELAEKGRESESDVADDHISILSKYISGDQVGW